MADFDDDMNAIWKAKKSPSKCSKLSEKHPNCSFLPGLMRNSLLKQSVKSVDAVIDYLPAPNDVLDMKGHDLHGNEITVLSTDDAPFVALAFKVMTDPFVGKLTFRVYSGQLQSGFIFTMLRKTNANGLAVYSYRMPITVPKSKKYGPVRLRLRWTTRHDNRRHALRCRSSAVGIDAFPEPASVAIEPKSKADQDRRNGLKLAEEDPTFKTYTNPETGQTIIAEWASYIWKLLSTVKTRI